jgi:hypothetical protein
MIQFQLPASRTPSYVTNLHPEDFKPAVTPTKVKNLFTLR